MSVLILMGSTVGCATAPPIPAEITTVTGDPAPFRNKRVELQGRVEDYEPPRGDQVRTWNFALRDLEGNRIQVYTEGRYPEDVEAAHALVRRSLDDRAPVFVIGYLRAGRYGSRSGAPRLDLREVQYRRDVVRLRERATYNESPYQVHIGVGYGHGYYDGGHHGYYYGGHHSSHKSGHKSGHKKKHQGPQSGPSVDRSRADILKD